MKNVLGVHSIPEKWPHPLYETMDVADERKRQLSYSDHHHHNACKRQRTPATPESDEEEAVMAAVDFPVSPDLSTLLETEITLPPVKVKIIDDPHSSSPPLIFQSSTSYITINGNEESCGSSFSESECSVMVGINSGFQKLAAEDDGAWDMKEAREWVTEEGINVGDCLVDFDYDTLEKFLGEDFCDPC